MEQQLTLTYDQRYERIETSRRTYEGPVATFDLARVPAALLLCLFGDVAEELGARKNASALEMFQLASSSLKALMDA